MLTEIASLTDNPLPIHAADCRPFVIQCMSRNAFISGCRWFFWPMGVFYVFSRIC